LRHLLYGNELYGVELTDGVELCYGVGQYGVVKVTYDE
jgi:hypothetical protein